MDYLLIGVCDDDCKQLDMKLYNDDDDLVGKDVGPGSTPGIEIVPPHTQEYHVRMIMSRCDNEPCYYGLGVYNN